MKVLQASLIEIYLSIVSIWRNQYAIYAYYVTNLNQVHICRGYRHLTVYLYLITHTVADLICRWIIKFFIVGRSSYHLKTENWNNNKNNFVDIVCGHDCKIQLYDINMLVLCFMCADWNKNSEQLLQVILSVGAYNFRKPKNISAYSNGGLLNRYSNELKMTVSQRIEHDTHTASLGRRDGLISAQVITSSPSLCAISTPRGAYTLLQC